MEIIQRLLRSIYGSRQGRIAYERLAPRIKDAYALKRGSLERFSERDAVLITYGDSLRGSDGTPLQALYDFASNQLKSCFSSIHFLPFFPYSSDDGFSVKDFYALDNQLGRWQDVARFKPDFDLMFDYVLNHVSAKSRWFEAYLAGDADFADLAIEVAPDTALSQVVRPRALPLLTPFTKADGKKVHVWTTFSEDQIDLNYQSIDVLLLMVDVLLFYVRKGVRWLRLDAVAYLWKEIGTSCVHHHKTHLVVRLLRTILDHVAPQVIIITETNVPHLENITYFGNGSNEAQLVYNFTLPPLLLHTFIAGDTRILSQWAIGLSAPSDQTTFFNFTASHDGIGVRPLEGILSPGQIETLVAQVKKNGGQVSYKHNSDGSKSPYELNITYVDALRRGDKWDIRRFLASQAIQLVLPGVPGVYIHSILGSRNWYEGVRQTGRARTINRERLDLKRIREQLETPESFRSQIFNPYGQMLKARRAQPAFHPNGGFEILQPDPRVFAIKRWHGAQEIFALTNVSDGQVKVSLKSQGGREQWLDLISGHVLDLAALTLAPFQSVWLASS